MFSRTQKRAQIGFDLSVQFTLRKLQAMEYRKLGKTGWNVSVVGYGAAPRGGVYGKLLCNF
jgi:hypothetical protein